MSLRVPDRQKGLFLFFLTSSITDPYMSTYIKAYGRRGRIVNFLTTRGAVRLLLILVLPVGVVSWAVPAVATHEDCTHFTGDSGHQIVGTNGADHCHGNNATEGDMMNGKDGADDLSGRGGNDVVTGDNGHDLLNGDDGQDTIRGKNGNDRMRGYNGADTFNDTGDQGDLDKVCDGPNGDTVYLNDGDGNDIWYVESSIESGDSWTLDNIGDTINYGGGCPISGS